MGLCILLYVIYECSCFVLRVFFSVFNLRFYTEPHILFLICFRFVFNILSELQITHFHMLRENNGFNDKYENFYCHHAKSSKSVCQFP